MPDNEKNLARGLPTNFPIDESSPNFKLLKPAGKAVEELEENIQKIDRDTSVQTAGSIGSLIELANLVGLTPRTNESREQYRSRTIAEFQLNTSRGTPDDLITASSVILEINPRTIVYREEDESGVSTLGLPKKGIDNLEIETSDFVDIIQSNTAAGYRVEAYQLGTFQYRSADDYTNGINVVEFGYSSLDEEGNPAGDGGTYAGLLD